MLSATSRLAFECLGNFLIRLLNCICSAIKLSRNASDNLRKSILQNRIHIGIKGVNKRALRGAFPICGYFIDFSL